MQTNLFAHSLTSRWTILQRNEWVKPTSFKSITPASNRPQNPPQQSGSTDYVTTSRPLRHWTRTAAMAAVASSNRSLFEWLQRRHEALTRQFPGLVGNLLLSAECDIGSQVLNYRRLKIHVHSVQQQYYLSFCQLRGCLYRLLWLCRYECLLSPSGKLILITRMTSSPVSVPARTF